MSLPMTYSRRKRLREQGSEAKIFRTNRFGSKLLTQILQSFDKMNSEMHHKSRLFPILVNYAREELGVLQLVRSHDLHIEFVTWWLGEDTYPDDNLRDIRLDLVEVACHNGLLSAKQHDEDDRSFNRDHQSAVGFEIEIINQRMLEDGFGFQYQDGQIIELTSQFAYEHILEPALGLLSNPIYATANQEFRDAFDEFKQGNYEDCIADCGNAFESVIKIIAAANGWTDVKETDTAAKLIDALYRNELIPAYMQEQYKGLRAMLQGAPTIRNKEGGHGAGDKPREIDKHLAAYQMHQTAAAVIFLVEQADL